MMFVIVALFDNASCLSCHSPTYIVLVGSFARSKFLRDVDMPYLHRLTAKGLRKIYVVKFVFMGGQMVN